MFAVDEFRPHFPMLQQTVNGCPLVYFDNAASSLKPKVVADRIFQYYIGETANIHRGAHHFSRLGTENFENTRDVVKRFIGASSSAEIVFTRGTTEAINLLMYAYGEQNIHENDIILLSPFEHHSNIVPWKMLADKKRCKIEVLPFSLEGDIDASVLKAYEGRPVKLVAMTLYSNVTGVRLDVEKVISWAQDKKIMTLVDAAQATLTENLDVQKMNCDFLVFSGHKTLGPYGVGVLYGKKVMLEKLPPFIGGGSMISQVSLDQIIYQDAPFKFEAGTPSIPDVIGLGTAIEFINRYKISDWHRYEMALIEQIENFLSDFPEVVMYGPRANQCRKSAVVSFNWKGAHASDVGEILDQMGVAVRAGHHCAQPLMKQWGIPGTVRISLAPYNSQHDVDLFFKAFQKVKDLL